MASEKQSSMMISIPGEFKQALRKLAAEQNLANPDKVESAAGLARRIILDHMTEKGIVKNG